MSIVDEILKFFGTVVLFGGGSAAVAYLLFQYLGKGWIDARFAERLEVFKHEQAKELQRMRIEVESVLSGALKLQELEFSVLPEAWKRLSEAYSLTSWFVSPLQQYPDLDRMDVDQLNEYLSKSELLDSQKRRLQQCGDRERNKLYQSQIFWHRLGRAKRAVGDFQEYLAKNGVFLPQEIRIQSSELAELLWSAITSKEVGFEAGDYKMQTDGWKSLQERGEKLQKSVEEAIERRLHSHGRGGT